MLAGLVSWGVGELAHDAFRPRLFKVQVVLQTFIQPTTESQNAADFKNAVLAFSILGCMTGLATGFAGGLARRSPSHGLMFGLGGAALGALFAGLAALVLLPLHFRQLIPDPNDLLTPVLIRSGVWTAIGLVGGAAFAVASKSEHRLVDAVVGACLGAIVASLLFHALSASLVADSAAEPLPSTSSARLLASLLVPLLIAMGATRGTLGRTRSSSAHSPTT